ncbi:MAG: hypothetical protein ABI574_20105 [Burkholderiales bacterium]
MNEVSEQYLAAAMQYGAAQRQRDFEAGNDPATKLGSLGALLRGDLEGQKLLLGLLVHDDPFVRLWAAKDCLAFDPSAGTEVLTVLEAVPGLLGTTARMTLSEWRAGRLFRRDM